MHRCRDEYCGQRVHDWALIYFYNLSLFQVVKAEAASAISTGTTGTTVAVKMLKEGHTDNDMIDLVSMLCYIYLLWQGSI